MTDMIRKKWNGAGRVQRIFVIAAAVWLMFIYSNSLKDAEVSTAQSDRVEEIVVEVIEKTDIPVPQDYRPRLTIRQTAHAAEFAVLGLLVSSALTGRSRSCGRTALTALALCGGIAVSDECLQYFVPGRGTQLSDMMLDVCGAGAAILAYFVLRWGTEKIISKKQ